MMKNNYRKGFTLVEIIIAMAIIGLLAAMAMLNYFSSKRIEERNICAANLKQIHTIVNVWALDNDAGPEVKITMSSQF